MTIILRTDAKHRAKQPACEERSQKFLLRVVGRFIISYDTATTQDELFPRARSLPEAGGEAGEAGEGLKLRCTLRTVLLNAFDRGKVQHSALSLFLEPVVTPVGESTDAASYLEIIKETSQEETKRERERGGECLEVSRHRCRGRKVEVGVAHRL